MPSPVHRIGNHNLWIVSTARNHILELGNTIRKNDRAEVEACGMSVSKMLWRGFRNSVMCRTALIDGQVAAIWGLCVGLRNDISPLSDLGSPWLLTAPIVETLPITFAKVAKFEMKKMLALCPKLESYVAADYKQAVRLVRMIGFLIDEAMPIGVNGAMLSRFHIGFEAMSKVN